MAAGDAYVKEPATVTDTSFMDLQPSAGVEVVVHNISIPEGTAHELYMYDGTDSILVMSFNSALLNMQLHCTNSVYYRVKNVSGASRIAGADGMTTK
jgi:hypothetical protein